MISDNLIRDFSNYTHTLFLKWLTNCDKLDFKVIMV